ncbi:MAG: DUF2589 domain-containing protein [Marinilabiliaceae bacterium]|nr:DUF2589 domain-containing protein [Marinilabiliaceae bacterium]
MIRFDALVDAIQKAVVAANESLMNNYEGVINQFFEEDEDKGTMRPKTVTLKYPQTNGNSVELVDVHVPLITLVPMSSSQIDELRLNTDLNVRLVKDVLHVDFASATGHVSKLFGKEVKPATAHLEIVIKPQEASEGLKHVVEGLEKVLRAQIPD